MNKKALILVSFLTVLLIFISSLAVTYSAVIEVTEEDNVYKIVNDLTIKDVLTNNDNTYNNTYYTVKNELNINDDDMDILINSIPLNNSLKVVLKSVVDYKLNGNNKMTNDEIYNLIVMSTNEDNTILQNLKNKVITKSSYYKNDISNFIYDIDVSIITRK